jgi:K+ transporter
VTYILAAVLIHDMGVGSVTAQVGHVMGLWFAVLAVLNVIAVTFLVKVLRHERDKAAARKAAKAEAGEPASPYAT